MNFRSVRIIIPHSCISLVGWALVLVTGMLWLSTELIAQQKNSDFYSTIGLDPTLDTPPIVPMLNPQPGQNALQVITTPDGFDNFDLGTTNAEPDRKSVV